MTLESGDGCPRQPRIPTLALTGADGAATASALAETMPAKRVMRDPRDARASGRVRRRTQARDDTIRACASPGTGDSAADTHGHPRRSVSRPPQRRGRPPTRRQETARWLCAEVARAQATARGGSAAATTGDDECGNTRNNTQSDALRDEFPGADEYDAYDEERVRALPCAAGTRGGARRVDVVRAAMGAGKTRAVRAALDRADAERRARGLSPLRVLAVSTRRADAHALAAALALAPYVDAATGRVRSDLASLDRLVVSLESLWRLDAAPRPYHVLVLDEVCAVLRQFSARTLPPADRSRAYASLASLARAARQVYACDAHLGRHEYERVVRLAVPPARTPTPLTDTADARSASDAPMPIP